MAMRIGLISDTHIPRDAKMLPPHVGDAFAGVDLILHAGDIYVPAILDELQSIAPVIAARGNGDGPFPDSRVEESHVLQLEGFKVGLTHSIGYPDSTDGLINESMIREFHQIVDIVVFGDTHVTMIRKYGDTLLVNPGSPTLPRGLFHLGTVGMLELADGQVKADIIQLSQLPRPFDPKAVYYPGYGA